MDESKLDKQADQASSPTSSPDELIKDLDVRLSSGEEKAIVGGETSKSQPQSAGIGIFREPTKHPS